MGHGRLSRTGAFRAVSNARKSGVHSRRMHSVFFEIFLEAPLPDCIRECAVTDRLASNLEVLGRGLATIGDFFVFDRLSFVERGKASFLDRRNMNKNVLAATRGLNESKTLGRVEPLHSTRSHHAASAGSKTIANCRPRKPAMPEARTIRGMGQAC